MKTTIFLVADRRGIQRMTKSLPNLYRGEIPIKLNITVDETAFRTPVIDRNVHIEDWREGIDMADIEFKQDVITPQEAELIRQKRLDKMQEILSSNGFEVKKIEEDE